MPQPRESFRGYEFKSGKSSLPPSEPSRKQTLRNIATVVRGEIADMKESVHKTPGKACMHALNSAFALIELHKRRPTKHSEKQSKAVARDTIQMMVTFMKMGGRISFTDPPENKDDAAGSKQGS